MNEAQETTRTNRCFGGKNCPQSSKQQQRTEKIKEVLTDAVKRKRANKELNSLLSQFHGRKSIFQLLPVIKRRCLPAVLALALERVEGRRDALSMEDLVFFEAFKASLKQSE